MHFATRAVFSAPRVEFGPSSARKPFSESDFDSYDASTSETATAALPPANRQTETFGYWFPTWAAPNAAPLTRGRRIRMYRITGGDWQHALDGIDP